MKAGFRLDLALLAAASLLLFGTALGAHDLWNPNEPIYGEAVKEMAARGSWAVPYVNGLPFGEKPILYYWLALAASRVAGGVSEAALRIPSVLAGTWLVLGVHLLVLPYAGRWRALATAVFTLTTYEVFWVSRTVQMDVMVAAATLGVVLPVTRVLDFGMSPRKGWALAGLAAGAGFLAKGPVAWICPGLTVLAYAAATRRVRTLVSPSALLGGGVALAVAAPWFVFLAGEHRDVLYEVLIRQNFQRFANPWDHVAPFWYYVPYLFVDMAPYALIAPIAWRLPRDDGRHFRLARLAWVWIAAIVVFFSLSKSKRDPYIVPVAPAVAILAAEVAEAFVHHRLSRGRSFAVRAVTGLVGAGFLAGAVALIVRVAVEHPESAPPARLLAGAAAAAGVALAVAAFHRERRPLPWTIASAAALIYLVVAIGVLPALDRYKSARAVCERIGALAAAEDTIASYNFWRWRSEYRYYLDRPIENLLGADALRASWDGPGRVVLLVDRTTLAGARTVIGEREPALSGKVGSQTLYVFTNR